MVKVKSVLFDGPSGRLEGILKFEEAVQPVALVVICHPHPLFQGTMHNKVVFALAEAFFGLGCEVLRFNFRGVGISTGKYDDGRGETQDALAALHYLRQRHPAIPCHVAGFSFGAWITIEVCRSSEDVESLTAVAPPFKYFDPALLRVIRVPKLFLQGTADEICPPDQLQSLFPSFSEPKAIVLLEGAGHFFAGQLQALKTAVEDHRRFLNISPLQTESNES
jgi:alpha/beta superfamily hydrolase